MHFPVHAHTNVTVMVTTVINELEKFCSGSSEIKLLSQVLRQQRVCSFLNYMKSAILTMYETREKFMNGMNVFFPKKNEPGSFLENAVNSIMLAPK